MDKAVVLVSGGMDSAALLHYVKKKLNVETIHALSFAYGQKHARELEMAKWQANAAGILEHKILDISYFADLTSGGSALTDKAIRIPDLAEVPRDQRMQPPTYVPNRNMVFLSLGAAYAECHAIRNVFYGAQAQDEYGYWDCTSDFVRRINEVLSLNRRNSIKIHAPFVGMSKLQVLKIGLELGVDYQHTWTCYRGGEEQCGACPSCVERLNALKEAGQQNDTTKR